MLQFALIKRQGYEVYSYDENPWGISVPDKGDDRSRSSPRGSQKVSRVCISYNSGFVGLARQFKT